MNACPHTVWLNRAAAWPAEDREPGWRCRACGIVRDSPIVPADDGAEGTIGLSRTSVPTTTSSSQGWRSHE